MVKINRIVSIRLFCAVCVTAQKHIRFLANYTGNQKAKIAVMMIPIYLIVLHIMIVLAPTLWCGPISERGEFFCFEFMNFVY